MCGWEAPAISPTPLGDIRITPESSPGQQAGRAGAQQQLTAQQGAVPASAAEDKASRPEGVDAVLHARQEAHAAREAQQREAMQQRPASQAVSGGYEERVLGDVINAEEARAMLNAAKQEVTTCCLTAAERLRAARGVGGRDAHRFSPEQSHPLSQDQGMTETQEWAAAFAVPASPAKEAAAAPEPPAAPPAAPQAGGRQPAQQLEAVVSPSAHTSSVPAHTDEMQGVSGVPESLPFPPTQHTHTQTLSPVEGALARVVDNAFGEPTPAAAPQVPTQASLYACGGRSQDVVPPTLEDDAPQGGAEQLDPPQKSDVEATDVSEGAAGTVPETQEAVTGDNGGDGYDGEAHSPPSSGPRAHDARPVSRSAVDEEMFGAIQPLPTAPRTRRPRGASRGGGAGGNNKRVRAIPPGGILTPSPAAPSKGSKQSRGSLCPAAMMGDDAPVEAFESAPVPKRARLTGHAGPIKRALNVVLAALPSLPAELRGAFSLPVNVLGARGGVARVMSALPRPMVSKEYTLPVDMVEADLETAQAGRDELENASRDGADCDGAETAGGAGGSQDDEDWTDTFAAVPEAAPQVAAAAKQQQTEQAKALTAAAELATKASALAALVAGVGVTRAMQVPEVAALAAALRQGAAA